MTPEDLARARLGAVAHMAGHIGHKARNRLGLVRAGLELLTIGAEAALTPEHRRELLAAFDRFLGDFNLGLELIRCDFGARETGSLAALATEAVELIRPHAEAKGLSVRCEFAGRPRGGGDAIESDPRLLRLVLLNLLRNAADAGARTVWVRTRFAGGQAVAEVTDDGPGVAAGVRAELFRAPVSTTGGAGLGLLLCADAAALLGGSIAVMDTERGAGFRLALPAA